MTTSAPTGPPPGPPGGFRSPDAPSEKWFNTAGGRQWIAIGVVVILAIAAVVLIPSNDGGGSIQASGSASASASKTSARTAPPKKPVQRTPAKTTGDNPFTSSVVPDTSTPSSTAPDATITPDAVASSGLTTQTGSTPGLYGGTRNVASCDVKQLISFLQQNPDKAQAFAAVQGIPVADLPAYVNGLTPVVLRADTAVTNHGFDNGVATPFQAVLQAGTAVLVDQYGIPRVRCFCGNPLLPPTTYTPVYEGPTWAGFNPNGIVTIAPAPTPIQVITIVDLGTGKSFDRPVGTDGSKDTDAKPTPSTTTLPGAAGGGAADPSGTYVVTQDAATLSGSEELVTKQECAATVTPGSTVNLAIRVNGRSIAISDRGTLALNGTYNPATGSFVASRPLPPPATGVTEVQTMTGAIDTAGKLTGALAITVGPPTAVCTIPLTGQRT